MDYIRTLLRLVVIIGAINWGLVAYNGTDLVTLSTTAIGQPSFDKYIKLIVGAAGVFGLYELYVLNFGSQRMR